MRKSFALAIILTLAFGPLGMLYATIPGAILMIIVSLFVFISLSFEFLIFSWVICIIWTVIAVYNYNKKLF